MPFEQEADAKGKTPSPKKKKKKGGGGRAVEGYAIRPSHKGHSGTVLLSGSRPPQRDGRKRNAENVFLGERRKNCGWCGG